jgi:hypothetical protein
MKAATNISSAHTIVNDVIKKIAWGKLDNMAPAGSIFSSISDMSKWVQMQLGNGKFNDNMIIPFSAIQQTRTPNSILGNGGHEFNKAHFALYGLGWFLEEYNGRKIVAHTGGVNGFVSSVALVPEENLGIVVLTNTDANNFYEALRLEIMDAYMDLPYRNYSGHYQEGQKSGDMQRLTEIGKKKDTIAMKLKTDVSLAALSGTYKHSIYGNMTISIKEGKAVALFQHHKGRFATLESLGGSRFLATFNDPLFGVKVWPVQVQNGKVKSITVRVADFVEFTPYEFVKI